MVRYHQRLHSLLFTPEFTLHQFLMFFRQTVSKYMSVGGTLRRDQKGQRLLCSLPTRNKEWAALVSGWVNGWRGANLAIDPDSVASWLTLVADDREELASSKNLVFLLILHDTKVSSCESSPQSRQTKPSSWTWSDKPSLPPTC